MKNRKPITSHTPHYDKALQLIKDFDEYTKKLAEIPWEQIFEDKQAAVNYWAAIAKNHEPERITVKLRLRAERGIKKMQREDRILAQADAIRARNAKP